MSDLNGDKPFRPFTKPNGLPYPRTGGPVAPTTVGEVSQGGITRRQEYAGRIMAGFAANPLIADRVRLASEAGRALDMARHLASDAWAWADVLLEQEGRHGPAIVEQKKVDSND